MYDKPLTVSYNLGTNDFGAGDSAKSITGPAGVTGILRGVFLSASETFNAVTTQAFIAVGTAADPDAYMDEYGLDTLAATNSVAVPDASFLERTLPADTPVEVTMTAPTGGTPTGIADVTVVIDWAVAQPG